MKKKLVFCLAVNLILLFVFTTVQISAQTKQRVRFARGAAHATVKGVVRGYNYIDYIVGARANQQISVTITAPKITPVFSVFKPGGGNIEGATEQDEFNCVVDKNGDYTIRVYLMRAAARRKNSVASFTLNIDII